jgi:hypothetical protein
MVWICGLYLLDGTSCGIGSASSVKSGSALYLCHFDYLKLRKTEKMKV